MAAIQRRALGPLTVAVLVAAAAAAYDELPAAAAFRLTLLHTNDMHSRYDETCRGDAAADGPCGVAGAYGGFARLRAALDAERAADPRAVYAYAGDTFHGTPFYNVLGWEPAADLVGDLGVDVMCLGNHEFEKGPKELGLFLKSKNISSIPIVVANIHTEEEPSLTNIRPSTVLTVGNRTLGVIGYLTPDTVFTNIVGKVKISDELQSIRTEVVKLKKSGVEFIIALGHSGLEMDRRVAREVDGIDVVIGGHSHSYLFSGAPQDTEQPDGPYPIIEKRGEQIVPVVQAYAFTKYLGKLILTFNSQKRLISAVGGPIFLDQTIPQDAKTLKKVEYYKKLLIAKQVKEIVGITRVFLDGNSKCTENNLANLITDSYIRINLENLSNNNITLKGWTDAATAISLSGSIQSSINASKNQGKIYDDDIEHILPYKTPLLKVTIIGSTLRKALEHSASLYGYINCAIPKKNIYGGFIQMSGMRVVYNMKNPVGSRVQSVLMQCSECNIPSYEPINLDKQYKLIMSNYIANGGDQYKMIKEGLINVVNLNITETDALRTYVKKMSPICAEIDNRITILN